MGYPMTWKRLVNRNALRGDYGKPDLAGGHLTTDRDSNYIGGDMRRLESDSRDEHHLAMYARLAGVTPEQVKIILDEFFSDNPKSLSAKPDQ